MSVKKTNETTAQKILNSDIYDITKFVDDIKKRTIDGIDSPETLLVGIYGYLGSQFSSLLQNSIITASELANEAIPTRAKFDRNVITHALSLGVEKVAATPSNMKILLMLPESALRANMIDGKFTLSASTPLLFEEYEFHTDYDIIIKYSDLTDSTNGSQRNYVYTAMYDMTNSNPISDIESPFLPPVSVFNYEQGNMIALSTNIHQVYYRRIYEKVLDSDKLSNKTISFSFEKQMSHFNILVREPEESDTSESNEVYLHAVYDGLYNQEIAGEKYCYYQYINSNTIRIRFDSTSYQPPANSDIIIECYTTDGASGNFEYTEEITIRLTSDKYTNLYCIIAQRDDEGATGGIDRLSVDQLQHIIPKEALSRGSITTLTDLKNFFNSLNNENSVLHVFRKEDNFLNRVYYVYNLMKDQEKNIVPTNTIPIYIESTRKDVNNDKLYIESGTPLFYYVFGDGTTLPIIRDNYTGFLQQKIANVETLYSFFNTNDYTTYQGTPTKDTLAHWYSVEDYRTSFDADSTHYSWFKYTKPKPDVSYDFIENGSIYFKPYYSNRITLIPDTEESYDRWFYGTCRSCDLKLYSADFANTIIPALLYGIDYYNDAIDIEIEWTEVEGNVTTVRHFPKRYSETLDPCKIVVIDDPSDPHNTPTSAPQYYKPYITIYLREEDDKYTIERVELNEYSSGYLIQFISNIRFYKPRIFDSAGNIIGPAADPCMESLPFDFNSDSNSITILYYAWITMLSFKDDKQEFCPLHQSDVCERLFWVPDYITDLSSIDYNNRKVYTDIVMDKFLRPTIDTDNTLLVLESINSIDIYSYDGQGEYSFDNLSLIEGDIIRFSTYLESEGDTEFVYTDPSTWDIGEVLSVEKTDSRITSVELLVKNEEMGDFDHYRYNIPQKNYKVGDGSMDSDYIVTISKLSKFLYTSPLSIVLKDNPTMNSHRITASYYLDIIDETRYLLFDCINSKSPIQYILPYIKVKRNSYLSDNRYMYTIRLNLKPNTGTVDKNMINRTQVIGIYYKNNKPIMYSIGKYVGGEDLNNINTENGIPFEFYLYTKPFKTSDKKDASLNRADIIDDENNVYMGPMEYINQLSKKYDINSKEAKEEFFNYYNNFWATANTTQSRPVDFDEDRIDLTKSGSGIALNDNDYAYYADTMYLGLNTDFKIYTLYMYDIMSTKTYTDGLTSEYLIVDNTKLDSLYNSIPQNTVFAPHIPVREDDTDYIKNYTLKQMVLTNVYSVYQGINLLYDYSDLMNSYVTSVKTNDIFNPANETIESYIVNRVPCIRYFYWWSEDRVVQFLKEMKKKITYVKDAISPLESTFGLDYKFFNTYGPSNMYHLTDDDGDVGELIDNVALTMTFRAKFYSEDTDTVNIKSEIMDAIKDYLENLDELDDIHFPNITTMIETEFSEYLIYFEFVSFNTYDALSQHIVCVEDMEMLSMVPEFLHVDTNDYNGLPYINIRIVTS